VDTFFLAEPFTPEKEKERRELAVEVALKEVLGEDFSEISLRVADKEPKDLAIFCDVCRSIQSSAYGIFDISGLNPNVLLELGMTFSLGKPVFVLVKKSEEEDLRKKLPSDIVWKRVIPYEEFIDITKELSKRLLTRPQIEPEPSFAEESAKMLEELDPALAKAVDDKLHEIKKKQSEIHENLKKLLERAKLSNTIEEKEIEIPASLEKRINRLYMKIEQMEKFVGFPENPETAFLRGNWLYHRKEYNRASELYDWTLTLKPDFKEAWHNKGIALSRLGRHEEAVASYDKAIEIKPDYEEAWYGRGYALDKLGRHEEAITSYDKTIEIKPDAEEAWHNRGNTLGRLGRHEEAVASYDKAIEIKPDYEKAWYGRGYALDELGRHEEAITSYDKTIEIKPDYEEAWYNRGIALYELGRHEEAVASYDKAIEIKPDDEEAWHNKGIALSRLGRHEEAVASYDKAIEIKPDAEESRKARARAIARLKKEKK